MDLISRARQRLDGYLSGNPEKPKSVDEQPSEDIQLVSFVRSELDEIRTHSARTTNEGIWLTNIAYLCGFDSIYFDTKTKNFKPIQSPNVFVRKNRIHVNRILPTIQNRLAKLAKSPPRYDVRPKTGDDADKDAARLAKQVLLQHWERQKINQKRINLLMWLQQCGHAYFKVSWDKTLGAKKAIKGENGEIELLHEGDIRVDVCSPFEIFPDPTAKTFEEARYVYQVKVRSLEYFRDHYENGHLVKPEDCWINSVAYEMRINAFNNQSGGSANVSGLMKNSALEISRYEKPSKKHPYGRHIIIANGVKLKDDVLPIDELPFAKFDDIKVAGKYNSEATITHLRPLQDQLNRTKSLRAAWTNRLLAGKYLAARSHNLSKEAFSDQSGEVVEYDPVTNADEPHAIQTPTIPQYAYNEDDAIKMDMDDTSGVNQASRGQMPSASVPAIGMQLLVEQDDTRIGVETEDHEYSYADLGRILLKFTVQYYVTERVVKVAGKNMEYTVKHFKGADLLENTDVYVVRGSTLPGSKVLRRQEIINLHERGYFGPPQDPKVLEYVLGLLEYGDEQGAWKRHSLIMQSIEKGLDMIEDGVKPPVSEFDNHALWIQELDNLRLSDKFDKLSEESKKILLEVMNEHINFGLDQSLPPELQENLDAAPDMQTTDAAKEVQDQLLAQAAEMGIPLNEIMPPGGMIEETDILQETPIQEV